MQAIAINVGANTVTPGFRAPVRPDGTFEYVPIPESEPTRRPVPTYGDLELATPVPADQRDTPVHLDPEFPEYPTCKRYTYGDEHGVKASPLSRLEPGDYLFFYATLERTPEASSNSTPDTALETTADTSSKTTADEPAWQPPGWGAYLIGHFRVARVHTGEEYRSLTPEERAPFTNNAHVKRETFDARVLLLGETERSELYDIALPLSTVGEGSTPNRLVTTLSDDSGKGPWWRRPLQFDAAATEELLTIHEMGAIERCFSDR